MHDPILDDIQDMSALGVDGVRSPKPGEVVKRVPRKGETFDETIHVGRTFQPGNELAKGTRKRKKGKRGAGRVAFKQRLEDILMRRVEAASDKRVADVVMEAGVAAAAKGDFQFWKYIMDRFEGPMDSGAGNIDGAGLTIVFAQVDAKTGEPVTRKIVDNEAQSDDDE